MRILFICGAGYKYGKEIIVLSLLDGLRKRGHEVACVTSSWSDGKFVEELTRLAIPYEKMPLGFISKQLSGTAIRMTLEQVKMLPQLWRAYRKFLKEFEPDIIVHSTFHHLVVLWPILSGCRNIFHVHDYFFPTKFYRNVLSLIQGRVQGFIGVSEFIATSLATAGIPRGKIGCVLNGVSVNPSINGTNKKGDWANCESNNKAEGLRIGIIGQIGPWKGHDDFLAALRALRELNKPFQAKIFGDGDPAYIRSLKDKANAWGLADSIHWAGFVADRKKIFSTIDLCIVPSRFPDPCPTVAIEAAGFGIPVIATRMGGLPEIIRNGETGYIVEPGSPQLLADRLNDLIEDPLLRHQMGVESIRHSQAALSPERMLDEIESVLLMSLSDSADIQEL